MSIFLSALLVGEINYNTGMVGDYKFNTERVRAFAPPYREITIAKVKLLIINELKFCYLGDTEEGKGKIKYLDIKFFIQHRDTKAQRHKEL